MQTYFLDTLLTARRFTLKLEAAYCIQNFISGLTTGIFDSCITLWHWKRDWMLTSETRSSSTPALVSGCTHCSSWSCMRNEAVVIWSFLIWHSCWPCKFERTYCTTYNVALFNTVNQPARGCVWFWRLWLTCPWLLLSVRIQIYQIVHVVVLKVLHFVQQHNCSRHMT